MNNQSATMINKQNQLDIAHIRFTWQALLWRLLLTGLILLLLAGSRLTIFNSATSRPDTHVLPPASQAIESMGTR
jgi:hypothetical protein